VLKKVLALYPQHVPALNLLGRIYCEAEQFAIALPYLRTLRGLRQEDPGVAYNSGLALLELGRKPEVPENFQAFLALAAGNAQRQWKELRPRGLAGNARKVSSSSATAWPSSLAPGPAETES